MKMIKYLGILCLFLGLNGCSQDDSMDVSRELNKVTFIGLNEKYSVTLYDYLNIPLSITTSSDEETPFSYLWYLSTATTRNEADTLSREKDLNVMIDPSHATPGEDYTLTVKVTDETSGVYYRKDMNEVLTEYTKGTLLLCEENGEAEVNFLTKEGERNLLENIYFRANSNQRVGKTPVKIYSVNPSEYYPDLKQELIFCQDGNGGMVASPVSFEALSPVKDAFATSFSGEVLNPQLYFVGGMIDYIIINGQVCKRGVNMGDLQWEAPLVCMDGVGNYEVAPFVMEVDGVQTFYDRLNKRLLQHTRWNMGALYQFDTENADLSRFDCNAMGTNMEMEACGNLSETNAYWMLMRNSETRKLYIYKFRINNEGNFVSTLCEEIPETVAPHIYEAAYFASNSDYSDILVYATSEQVFAFSVNQFTTNTSSSLEALLVTPENQNTEITGMKFITIQEETDQPDETRSSLQIRLCIRNLSLPELQGGVEFYEVSSQGGIHADFLFGKSGFCDTVIDIDEKYS